MRGEFKSTLDAKGRMNFPVKLREELGTSFVISKTIGERCIKVYSKEDWDLLVESIRKMPQVKTAEIQRFIFGSAFEVEPDKQGRVLIPSPLREYAELKTDIVIVGLEGRAEIWDKQRWDGFNSSLDMEQLMAAAMEMEI
ncbi:MAG: division/cell wall cluster transcriptional repressor MraZ [Firmicutes bacterium]|nr:division/cell wall cluster transcriptional repressor MraZ [[Eubacterium] siraeum]MCM1486843.1 division/cell wall cluster transcriptional repressor MraZ [Bacillota bacterium]